MGYTLFMDAITRIRAQRGLMARIAADLNIGRNAVGSWTRVPASRLTAVARLTGIPVAELRPDLAVHFVGAPAGADTRDDPMVAA